MPNLAKVVDVELVLVQELTDPAHIASVEFGLAIVSAAVRNFCNQTIHRVEDDVITISSPGTPLLFLPELPVVAISVLDENGTTLYDPDDYLLLSQGMLVRYGRPWWRGHNAVTVTYTHGYDPIPDDIVGVVARAAARLFQAGLRAAETSGVLGIASKSLGDFSVSYTAEASAAEGVMGVSGARVLTLSEKDILIKYKL